MKAMAHEVLGIVAFERGHYAESVAEFETCTRQNPAANGAQYYRLGIAYLFKGDYDQAKVALQRASQLGPEIVRAKAERQLAKLFDEDDLYEALDDLCARQDKIETITLPELFGRVTSVPASLAPGSGKLFNFWLKARATKK